MFYCKECADKYAWPYTVAIHRSHRKCDSCGYVKDCLDVPSKYLDGTWHKPDGRGPKPKLKEKAK